MGFLLVFAFRIVVTAKGGRRTLLGGGVDGGAEGDGNGGDDRTGRFREFELNMGIREEVLFEEERKV